MTKMQDNPSTGRITRRGAIGGGAAGLAELAISGSRVAVGQEATPAALEVSLLFVQTFAESALDPSVDNSNNLTLTLKGDSGHTLCFADRPSRLAGIIDTAKFVDMFRGETAQDPANAV